MQIELIWNFYGLGYTGPEKFNLHIKFKFQPANSSVMLQNHCYLGMPGASCVFNEISSQQIFNYNTFNPIEIESYWILNAYNIESTIKFRMNENTSVL